MRAPAEGRCADPVAARGERERQRSSPAEAERADARALAGVAAEQHVDSGIQRVGCARRIEGGREPACLVDGSRRSRAEPIRSERDEALTRQAVAGVAGEVSEALRLVDHQNPRPECSPPAG